MKKNLFLYIIIVFLIVMNGFFLFKHFRISDKIGPQRLSSPHFITDQLEFDSAQLEKFEELDKAHREKLNAIRRKIRTSKDKLFDKASDETFNDSEIETITSQIADMEKEKGLVTFRFFNSISELCSEDQRKRFKKIIKDGLRGKGPPRGNRPPNKSGFREHRPPPPN